MTTSVVVSTYNGASKLPYLLDALTAQTIQDFELIIVVDGSVDNTIDVLKGNARRFNSFRIIEQQNAGRSKVKNRGASEATGELLVFYDDDMVPFPGSIERHVQLHLDGVGKLVSGNPIELMEPGKTDIQNYKATRTAKWTEKYVNSVTRLTTENLFFSAANCSIKRSLLQTMNGFDERLTDAEDFNLAVRALKSGIPVLFDKDNTAIHRDFITARGYVLRLRQYRTAHDKLYSLLVSGTAPVGQSVPSIKKFTYFFFARPMWIKWIDNHGLMFLPERFRYKLYDIILQSLSSEYPHVSV